MGLKIYKCAICGKEFIKIQSLQAHKRAHKGEWSRFVVRVPKELKEKFLKVLEKHGITTCALQVEIMKRVIEADEKGFFFLGSNPIVFASVFIQSGKPTKAAIEVRKALGSIHQVKRSRRIPTPIEPNEFTPEELEGYRLWKACPHGLYDGVTYHCRLAGKISLTKCLSCKRRMK